jgi:hypothetical protein
MAQIELLSPVGEHVGGRNRARALSPRLERLQGATIGIFSNSWQCMNYLSQEMRERLPSEFGVKEVIIYDSPTTNALPRALLESAAARCDAAIVGIGT